MTPIDPRTLPRTVLSPAPRGNRIRRPFPSLLTTGRLPLFWIAALLLLLAQCKKESPPRTPGEEGLPETSEITGLYVLEPSFQRETLRIGSGGEFLLDKEGNALPIKGRYDIRGRFLRLYLPDRETPGPTGVFPLSGYHPAEWKGIWKGNIRFLKKVRNHPSAR